MIIRYSNRLNKLPALIEQCSAPVYAVFGNNERIVLNANPEMIKLFKGTCESCTGSMELNLQFSDSHDSSNIFNYLVSA